MSIRNPFENFNLDLPGEIWREIPGYEGLYWISDLGRVKSNPGHKGEMILKNGNVCGYHNVVLRRGGKSKTQMVHRLVAAAFLGPCPEGYQVNHKDFNRTNNHPDNLEYLSPAENVHHAMDHGHYGGNHRTLTPAEVTEIRKLIADGVTLEGIAFQFKVHRHTIYNIKKGLRHARTASIPSPSQ